jgi:hypothetical protein
LHVEITVTEAGSSDGEHRLARHWARRWDILEFKGLMDANKTNRFHDVLPSLILLGEQPEDLPPAARMRLVGPAIPLFELVGCQVGIKVHSSRTLILQCSARSCYQVMLSDMGRAAPVYRLTAHLTVTISVATKSQSVCGIEPHRRLYQLLRTGASQTL